MRGRAGSVPSLLADQRGQSTVLVALALTAIVGFMAISLDVGRAYVEHFHLQGVAQGAALSGAAHLPADPAAAVATALDVTTANGIPPADAAAQVEPDGQTLVVTVKENLPYLFARVLGFAGRTFAAEGAAKAGSVQSMTRLAPLGVPESVMESVYTPCQEVVLKQGSGRSEDGSPDDLHGNFGAITFPTDPDDGAQAYRDDLEHGCQGQVHIGEDDLVTKPGDMTGPTIQAIDDLIAQDPDATCATVSPSSPRVLYVPVVKPKGEDEEDDGDDSDDMSGRTAVKVVGFAAFFVEKVEPDGAIIGRFLPESVRGQAGSAQYPFPLALDAVQLVQPPS